MATTTITFADIFKTGFLDKLTSISVLDMVIAMGLAFGLGLFILLVYRKTFKGVMYSESFGVALMALTLITTLIILAVTSNVILSLGMVGALSIVRFRSAVKEPLDIAFLFWAISAGIVTGAGLLPLAVVGSLFIGIIMVLFANRKTGDTPYIVVLNCADETSEQAGIDLIKQHVKKYAVKSKTVSPTVGIELTVEVRLKDSATSFVNGLSQVAGIGNVALVSYNGEYVG
ncbi:MAG: DUF4956 domain-containing protein [Caldisericota bacterium]|jgi:uncharacterized membrane protein YhiD involved in acid resistance|nr:DUF4956 domain-containing protein [Caldisericota bacterium]